MREQRVGKLQQILADARRAVELDEVECGMQEQISRRFRPAPYAFLGDGGAAEIRGADVAMACRVDTGESLDTGGRPHRALEMRRTGVVEQHRLPKHLDALLVA